MRTFLTLLCCAFSLIANSATYTIHNFKDNWLWVDVSASSPSVTFCEQYVQGYWDFYDQSYSGVKLFTWSGQQYEQSNVLDGYSDAMVLTVTPNSDQQIVQVFVGILGGGPSYLGWSEVNEGENGFAGSSTWNFFNPNGGEYWVDFSSDGTARVSTTQPPDFGKWAWDGSINPSWVEPPLAPARKRGKGHNK